MGHVRPARVIALLCGLLILSASVEAQQRWYEAYDAGVKAFQRGDLDSAEASLTSALSKNSKQGRQQFFYGTIYADYFPDYYLAQILLKRGKPQQASELLDRLASGGIMRPRDREYAEFTRLQTEARTASARLVAGTPTGTSPGPVSGPAPVVVEPRPAGATPPAVVTAEPATTPTTTATLARRFDDRIAQGDYRGARALLDEARGRTPSPEFREMERRVDLHDAQAALDAAVARGDWTASEGLLDAFVRLKPDAAQVSTYRATIQRGRDRLAVSQLERSVLQVYYRGAYDEVIKLVQDGVAPDRATGRLLLYAACSNAALALLQRPGADGRLVQARQQFARAERLGALTPADTRYISPSVLQLLRGGR